MSKDVKDKEYKKAWKTMEKLIVNINHKTPKDDPDIQKFIAAYKIVKAYEERPE